VPIEHDYLEHGFGHFEGRSYLGWHRYVTLAALAQAFCAMMRVGPKPLRRDGSASF
jgi:SRSO17 transposase